MTKKILLALCFQRITSPSLCPDFPSRPPAATTLIIWTYRASERTTMVSVSTATARIPRASSRKAPYPSSTWNNFSWETRWAVQRPGHSLGDVDLSLCQKRRTLYPLAAVTGEELWTKLAGGDSGLAPRPRHQVSLTASDSATRTRSFGARS